MEKKPIFLGTVAYTLVTFPLAVGNVLKTAFWTASYGDLG